VSVYRGTRQHFQIQLLAGAGYTTQWLANVRLFTQCCITPVRLFIYNVFSSIVTCRAELFGRPSLSPSPSPKFLDFENPSDSACLFVYAFIL
jgi:hypothetical protein